MIFPMQIEQEIQESSMNQQNDSSSFNQERNQDDYLLKKPVLPKKQKLKLEPIKFCAKNSPQRSMNARRRWRMLSTVFLSIRQFRSNSVCNIDSPEKLQADMTNFTSSPLKRVDENSKMGNWQCQNSFVSEHQLIDYFVKLAENGSQCCMEEMLLILNRNPKKHLYGHSDPNHLLNLKNKQGQNALYLACKNGNVQVVDLLLRNGVNPMIKSKIIFEQEEDALSVSIRWGHVNCVQFLLDNVTFSQQYLIELRTKTNNAQIKMLLGQNQSSCLCC